MALAPYVRAWTGDAYRNIPARHRTSVLDLRYAGRLSDNRWNVQGEPTLYLAGDPGVATAEFARHIDQDRSPDLRGETIDRDIFVFADVSVERVLDLRDQRVLDAISLTGAPTCFLDALLCRATAALLRRGQKAFRASSCRRWPFLTTPAGG